MYDASWVVFSPAPRPTPERSLVARALRGTGRLKRITSSLSLDQEPILPILADALKTTQISVKWRKPLVPVSSAVRQERLRPSQNARTS